eukprot:m.279807 g.279807  ORF g.279807 m.279807 type:complete len:241 (+) comp54910_c0_seq1:223-945(+)
MTDSYKIFVAGTAESGKTSFVGRASTNEFVGESFYERPFAKVTDDKADFMLWDSTARMFTGGRGGFRTAARATSNLSDGVVFLVDSTAPDTFGDAAVQLRRLVETDTLKSCPFLVLCNKCDLPNAASVDDMKTHLKVAELPSAIVWHVTATSNLDGTGVSDAMGWIKKQLLLREPQAKSKAPAKPAPAKKTEAKPSKSKVETMDSGVLEEASKAGGPSRVAAVRQWFSRAFSRQHTAQTA